MVKKLFVYLNILTLVVSSVPYPASAQTATSSATTDNNLLLVNPPATSSAETNGPTVSFSDTQNSNATLTVTPPVFAYGLSKANYQAREQIEMVVKNVQGKKLNVIVTSLTDSNYAPNVAQNDVNGETIITVYPSSELKPGRYKIKVIDQATNTVISEQDFTWGVLAINTNKSIYLPNETAKVAIGVLNERGDMVCNAKVNLEIEAPDYTKTILSTEDGTIVRNTQCWLHHYQTAPDYGASYQTFGAGRYNMTLTATTENGTYTTKDRFEVRDFVPFDVERDSATRIYPPDTYDVRVKIHANEDFKGKIIETVPKDFQISTIDDSSIINYQEETALPDTYKNISNYGIPSLSLPFNGDYPVTLGFGQQIDDPKDKEVYKKSGLDGHDGIDFGLPEGTPVLSVDEGKVILAKENWIYGTSVVIEHRWGRTYYGHLSKIEVTEGENVSRGTEIGLSGHTGLATGPHLHFGLKPNEYDINNLYFGKIDPSPYLGVSSEDPVLTASTYPINAKALVWNVDISKGADFVLGYKYKAPPKSPNFYTIGPLKFIGITSQSQQQAKFDVSKNPFVLGASTSANLTQTASGSADLSVTASPSADLNTNSNTDSQNEQVVFAEIRSWQIAVDAATTIVITTAYTDSCGANQWTVPTDWNYRDNSIEVIGAGGNGAAGTTGAAGVGGGGGGGGAYAKVTNQAYTPSGCVNYQLGTGGSGTASWFNTSGTVNAGAGGNASGATKGNGGTVGAGTGYTGGAGGAGASNQVPGGGGGGAAGPNGIGGAGGDSSGSTTNNGGSGGGGNGGGSAGSAATSANGGNGGDIFGGGGHGGAGDTGAGAGNGDSGGGGGGGQGISGAGTAGAGGTGSMGLEWSASSAGTGGGGGGGGSNSSTGGGGTRAGGAGGTPVANTGSGGGGGGGGRSAGGNGGTGSNAFIVITYTPYTGPTLDQVMRHGKWISSGVEQPFTF